MMGDVVEIFTGDTSAAEKEARQARKRQQQILRAQEKKEQRRQEALQEEKRARLRAFNQRARGRQLLLGGPETGQATKETLG